MRAPASAAMSVVAISVLVGCTASLSPEPPLDPPRPAPTVTLASGEDPGSDDQPGPFLVWVDESELQLYPYTYCVPGVCADGHEPDPLSLGSPDEVFVRIPASGMDELHASLRNGERCASLFVPLEPEDLGEGWWRLTPAGPADDYTLHLFAQGRSGDAAADARWTTTANRPLPQRHGRRRLH